VGLGSLDELEGDEFVAAFLEAGDDLADERALNAVRLEEECKCRVDEKAADFP
jgi:hypothetical protein